MISIHAPAWGRDLRRGIDEIFGNHFNPRARMGARPIAAPGAAPTPPFQSTRPHGGATAFGTALPRGLRHFNPRARMGARPADREDVLVGNSFQSTRPHGGATTE